MKEDSYGYCEDCGKEIEANEAHYNFGGPKVWCAKHGENKVSPSVVI